MTGVQTCALPICGKIVYPAAVLDTEPLPDGHREDGPQRVADLGGHPERGYPFQVVAEDKLGYKWAKWVTGIEVSNDADYRGYWESRGYDNDAAVAP